MKHRKRAVDIQLKCLLVFRFIYSVGSSAQAFLTNINLLSVYVCPLKPWWLLRNYLFVPLNVSYSIWMKVTRYRSQSPLTASHGQFPALHLQQSHEQILTIPSLRKKRRKLVRLIRCNDIIIIICSFWFSSVLQNYWLKINLTVKTPVNCFWYNSLLMLLRLQHVPWNCHADSKDNKY